MKLDQALAVLAVYGAPCKAAAMSNHDYAVVLEARRTVERAADEAFKKNQEN